MARKSSKPAVKGKSKTTRSRAAKPKATKKAQVAVPVVGLGASAGGLEAFSAFLDNAPSDSGAAFVLIHHLDPDHESFMASLLDKHTSIARTVLIRIGFLASR